MKNRFRKFAAAFYAAMIICLLTSCYTPNPLYGTWKDNEGNKIQFVDDGTFTSVIKESDNNLIEYQGEWTIIDNVLIFNIKGDSVYTRTTEWDIRGAMLYITWTSNGTTRNLTLYHTAR